MKQDQILNMFLDNIQKILYPQEWIDIDFKLSKTELFTMLIVDRHGEVIMSNIANSLNISMSTATGIVDRLVSKNYLKRERSTNDRRIVVIKLSQEGKEIISNLKDTLNHYISNIYETLTDEEVKLLSKIILKVIRVFSDEDKQDNVENENKKTIKKINIE
ncbi:transcriptional regulator [Gottschalkia purinilytica]|uniref:Transcriptional regulator n=1 Tax=Gottschalkia purinilytica TaxID=1503 RepID=A0A0L0W9Y3_GOTPU|nr:MarR family transcriptional regulator [Gottschalkia purinilytica]KNF08344.1 transcriptional regulator [Gottschalkia purinilytica]